eukprot:8811773-Pyramimonas_sp.AAC.1
MGQKGPQLNHLREDYNFGLVAPSYPRHPPGSRIPEVALLCYSNAREKRQLLRRWRWLFTHSERKKVYHQVQVREQRLKSLTKVAEGMALAQALR